MAWPVFVSGTDLEFSMPRPRHLAAVFSVLLVLAPLSAAQQKSSPAERELFAAVNRERKAQGLPSLRWDDALADAARKHAEAMAQRGAISHQVPGEQNLLSRAKAAGLHFTWLSENVDAGTDAAAIHESFMKSALHRANILDTDMDSVGISVFAHNGRLYVTEDFAKVR
jgi:uncharacterized protein YkwD